VAAIAMVRSAVMSRAVDLAWRLRFRALPILVCFCVFILLSLPE